MVVKASRAIWAGWLVCVVGGIAAASTSSGCSSSSSGTTQAADSAAVCPATIQDTVGASCTVEGLKCGPTFSCGATQVPIYCTCFDGAFSCVDGAGNPFDGSTTPTCPTDAGGGGACPVSENAASLAPCTEAQSGKQCAYSPRCDGGTQTFDLCTCTAWTTASGTQAFQYVCENSCSGVGGPVDAGGSSSGGEPKPEAGPGAEAGGDSASE